MSIYALYSSTGGIYNIAPHAFANQQLRYFTSLSEGETVKMHDGATLKLLRHHCYENN